VEIWDVETQGVVRILEAHVRAVTGLGWSRNNRYLITASLDATAIIWDLAVVSPLLRARTPAAESARARASARARTIRFDAPVTAAAFHPRNARIVLASMACAEVVLVDLRSGGNGEHYVLRDMMAGEGEEEGAGEGAPRKK
jgi:COMPASS component SWD1